MTELICGPFQYLANTSGHIECALFLLESGTNINTKDEWDLKPIQNQAEYMRYLHERYAQAI